MRSYHCLLLLALLIYLMGDSVHGAPTKEPRRMWVDCNNGTCITKMSTNPRPNQLFPDRETQDMDQVLDSDESSEEDLSGDGSGIVFPFLPSGAQEEKGNHLDDWQQEIEQNVVEEGSGEVNYGNDIIPMKPQLSAKDLELDNMIQ